MFAELVSFSFTKFGNILAIISSNISFALIAISFPLESLIAWILDLLMVVFLLPIDLWSFLYDVDVNILLVICLQTFSSSLLLLFHLLVYLKYMFYINFNIGKFTKPLFFLILFYFKLYITVLDLPNIKMNPPQVYMCSLSNSVRKCSEDCI